jgi:hypothetical protein
MALVAKDALKALDGIVAQLGLVRGLALPHHLYQLRAHEFIEYFLTAPLLTNEPKEHRTVARLEALRIEAAEACERRGFRCTKLPLLAPATHQT